MKVYELLSDYWNLSRLVIAALVVWMSFTPSTLSYWVGVVGFTMITWVSVGLRVIQQMNAIAVANSDGASVIPGDVYLALALPCMVYVVLALVLAPILSPTTSFKIAVSMFGALLLTAVGGGCWSIMESSNHYSAYDTGGHLNLVMLLLWLRVHDMRPATKRL